MGVSGLFPVVQLRGCLLKYAKTGVKHRYFDSSALPQFKSGLKSFSSNLLLIKMSISLDKFSNLKIFLLTGLF